MDASNKNGSQSVSNAEKCKKYREKRKNDKEYKKKERERKQYERANRTQEQIERDRQSARVRVQRYRQKKLQEQTETLTIKDKEKPMLTRKQTEAQREKWRKYKQTYRVKLGSQKKRRIREKDLIAKQKKRDQKKIKQSMSKTPKVSLNFSTNAAARQAVCRAKKGIPRDPPKFVEVVRGVIDSATPKKRKMLSENNLILTPRKRRRINFMESTLTSLKSTINNLKKNQSHESIQRRKFILKKMSTTFKKNKLLSKASGELGIRWKTLLKWSKSEEITPRKKRSDALPEKQIKEVEDFYLKPYVSVIHSTKVTVSKDHMQRQSLNQTIRETHEMFKTEKNSSISFSKFAKIKPKQVKTVDKQRLRGCLCERCVNIELKLKTLNKELSRQNPIKDRYNLNKMTICEHTTSFPNIKCVNRQCSNCGVKLFQEFVCSHTLSLQKAVTWYKWQTCKMKNKKSGVENSRKMLVSHVGTLQQLVDETSTSLNEFSLHLFEAKWQYKQFTQFKEQLPNGYVLSVLDFAENYTAQQQDEVQSAHWAQDQITIHPIVCYYNADSIVKTHELVFISDDIKHDAHFVEACVKKTIKELRETVGIEFSKMVQFTDGCSSQYKSKVPFLHISCTSESNGNIEIERNFFGSGHGKGPSDACSGVVKSAATRAIKGGRIIANANQMINFANETLTRDSTSFKRTFHIVSSDDINRENTPEVKAVNGTRKIHSVRSVAPFIIQTRKLTCLCNFCLGNTAEKCDEGTYVDHWNKESLKADTKKKKKKSQSKTKKTKSVRKKKNTTSRKKKENKVKSKSPKEGSSKSKTKPSNLNIEKSNETVKNKDISEIDFDTILTDLQGSDTFTSLQEKCKEYKKQITEIEIVEEASILGNNLIVDKEAYDILPNDLELVNAPLFPACVLGDGNCLPRSGSVLAFGVENRHIEIRVRIILELAINEYIYTDYKYLKRGLKISEANAIKIPVSYAMYSDVYLPGDILTTEVIQRIFRQEVLKICNLNEFMGIWQMFGLASVLDRPLLSVYPNIGNINVRKDLNRQILPRKESSRSKVHVMWTSTRSDMEYSHWVPNHFVPILPLTIRHCSQEPLVEKYFEANEMNDTSDIVDGILGQYINFEDQNLIDLVDETEMITIDDGIVENKIPGKAESLHMEILKQESPITEEIVKEMLENNYVGGEIESNMSEAQRQIGDKIRTEISKMEDQMVEEMEESMLKNRNSMVEDIAEKFIDQIVEMKEKEILEKKDLMVSEADKKKTTDEMVDEIGKDILEEKDSKIYVIDVEVLNQESTMVDEICQEMLENNFTVNNTENDVSEPQQQNLKTEISEKKDQMCEKMDEKILKNKNNMVVEIAKELIKQMVDKIEKEISEKEELMAGEVDKQIQKTTGKMVDERGNEMWEDNYIVDDIETQLQKMKTEMSEKKDKIYEEMDEKILKNKNMVLEIAIDEIEKKMSERKDQMVDAVDKTMQGSIGKMVDQMGKELLGEKDQEIDETDKDILDKESQSRFSSGTYLSVRHGKQVLPTVVSDWPCVTFFSKKKTMWVANDIEYIITEQDVIKVLNPPERCKVGSRTYFKFIDMD